MDIEISLRLTSIDVFVAVVFFFQQPPLNHRLFRNVPLFIYVEK